MSRREGEGEDGYPSGERIIRDAESRIELAQEILARVEPLTEASPGWRYLTERRRLPAETVRAALPELRAVSPLLPGRAKTDYATMSLLRDPTGEVVAFQLVFHDITGNPAPAAEGLSKRQTYVLRREGLAGALFRVPGAEAGGATHLTGFMAEGFLEKPIALAAAGLAPVYGWGGRPALGLAVPPEPRIVVVPDRRPQDDPQAARHDGDMAEGIDRLKLAGRRVLVAPAPDCAHPAGDVCKDADDVLRRHGPILLKELVERAEEAPLSPRGEVRRLAAIPDRIAREMDLKATARRIGLTVKLLRAEVRRFRGGDVSGVDAPADDTAGVGTSVASDEIEAADGEVDGAALLDEMAEAIRRHARIGEADVTAAVLWTVHGHRRFHGNVGVLPRLIITAGREDSGKTHLGLCLYHMTDSAVHTVSPRPANIYRAIEAHQVAFFLDETDVWYPRQPELQEIINSGFNRDGATVLRVEDVGKGDRRELRPARFSTYTPMALIGNNLERTLARTVTSRAVLVRMRPAMADDEVEDLYDNPAAVAKLRALASKIKRWIADHELELCAARPERPEGARNRLWIVWRPLLAIAELAGGDWPRRAREAFAEGRARGADAGLGIQLLGDVLDILKAAPDADGRMHTKDIIAKLLPLELRSWSVYGKAGTAIRDTDVAALLRPYEVEPEQMKLNGLNRRGYKLADVRAAVERYAPHLLVSAEQDPPETRYPATDDELPSGNKILNGSGPVAGSGQPATEERNVTAEKRNAAEIPEEHQGGSTVAGEEHHATGIHEEKQSGSGVAPAAGVRARAHTDGAGAAHGGNGAAAEVAVCATCGSMFERSAGAKRPAKHCSARCRQASYRRRKGGADNRPRVRFED